MMKIVVTAKVIHDDGSTYQETLLTLQKTAEQGEPLGLSLNESKILLNSAQLAIIQGFYAGTAEISEISFSMIFRDFNNTISNPLCEPLHPFCKAVISWILLAYVIHLDF